MSGSSLVNSKACRLTLLQLTLIFLSRRGVNSPDINLMVLHPDHVHVPLPPSPEALPKSHKRYGYIARFDAHPYLYKLERTWTPLQEEIVPYLELRGLIAKTRKKIFKSWYGVIRLPGLNEQEWQNADTRLQAIRNKQGDYRRLNIQYVHLPATSNHLLNQISAWFHRNPAEPLSYNLRGM